MDDYVDYLRTQIMYEKSEKNPQNKEPFLAVVKEENMAPLKAFSKSSKTLKA